MSSVGVQTLASRISNVIAIHREARDVTIAEIIGLLEIIKLDMYQEIADQLPEEKEYGEGAYDS